MSQEPEELPACELIDKNSAEQVLQQHPGVSEVAVFEDGDGRWTAWIVPEDRYLDETLGRKSAAAAAVRKWSRLYELTQYATKAAQAGPDGFRTVSWESSYTRQPIPAEEMHEWVNTSVQSILDLKARSVCEIG